MSVLNRCKLLNSLPQNTFIYATGADSIAVAWLLLLLQILLNEHKIKKSKNKIKKKKQNRLITQQLVIWIYNAIYTYPFQNMVCIFALQHSFTYHSRQVAHFHIHMNTNAYTLYGRPSGKKLT